jgi:hypothetical protein
VHDDDQAHGAAAAAREEAARQTVWLAVMLLAIPVLAWAERKFTNPDTLKTMRMQAAREAERFCAAAAADWWRLAERARRAYERECA